MEQENRRLNKLFCVFRVVRGLSSTFPKDIIQPRKARKIEHENLKPPKEGVRGDCRAALAMTQTHRILRIFALARGL